MTWRGRPLPRSLPLLQSRPGPPLDRRRSLSVTRLDNWLCYAARASGSFCGMERKPTAEKGEMATSSRRAAVLFGAVLRRERTGAGFTQEGLAEAAGLHHTFVSRLERGERAPSLETVLRLADALGVSPTGWVEEVQAGWEREP